SHSPVQFCSHHDRSTPMLRNRTGIFIGNESLTHRRLRTSFPPLFQNNHRNIQPDRRKEMPEVSVRKGEPIDRALKRLKSKLEAEGIMDEVRRLRAFETPTQRTKRKAKANAKRAKAKFRFNVG
ncbi:MAG: 30S ribosomal protein S21, partial [Chthoniobacteraceae bacterium]